MRLEELFDSMMKLEVVRTAEGVKPVRIPQKVTLSTDLYDLMINGSVKTALDSLVGFYGIRVTDSLYLPKNSYIEHFSDVDRIHLPGVGTVEVPIYIERKYHDG